MTAHSAITRPVLARAAGATLLLFWVVKGAGSILFEGALGNSAAGRLAAVSANVGDLRTAVVLALMQCVFALVIGVLLYFYSRTTHGELSTLVLLGRVGEAMFFGVYALGMAALIVIATRSTPATTEIDATLVAVMARSTRHATLVAEFFFSLGSAAFAWILLRARLAPRYLAVLGLIASVVPIVGMPLQIIGATRGFNTGLFWILMLVFEIWLAIWFLKTGGRESEVESRR